MLYEHPENRGEDDELHLDVDNSALTGVVDVGVGALIKNLGAGFEAFYSFMRSMANKCQSNRFRSEVGDKRRCINSQGRTPPFIQ